MSYPMIELSSPFGGITYREMTPEEYEESLNHSRNYIARNCGNDSPRRVKEYISYLKRWFGNESCDGVSDFKTRYAMHLLPMSPNVFMFH